jgi:hypothetical protein
MKKLNEDLFFNIQQIPSSLLISISENEGNSLNDNSQERVLALSKSLTNVENIDYDEIVDLLSKLDSKTLSSFILNANSTDSKLSIELLNSINRLAGKNLDSAKFVSEKLLSLYKLSLFTSVFSDSRLKALKVALRNY